MALWILDKLFHVTTAKQVKEKFEDRKPCLKDAGIPLSSSSVRPVCRGLASMTHCFTFSGCWTRTLTWADILPGLLLERKKTVLRQLASFSKRVNRRYRTRWHENSKWAYSMMHGIPRVCPQSLRSEGVLFPRPSIHGCTSWSLISCGAHLHRCFSGFLYYNKLKKREEVEMSKQVWTHCPTFAGHH